MELRHSHRYSTLSYGQSCFLGILSFNTRIQVLVSEWLRNGWLCAQSGEQSIYLLVANLHSSDISDRRAAFRIARQLLALAFFLEPVGYPKLQWPRRYFYNVNFVHRSCAACALGHRPETTLECQRVLPLINEFFRNPLSLQQLSRIELRRSVGMIDFERRIQTLPLPPSLLAYTWRANEFLADVLSPLEEFHDDYVPFKEFPVR